MAPFGGLFYDLGFDSPLGPPFRESMITGAGHFSFARTHLDC